MKGRSLYTYIVLLLLSAEWAVAQSSFLPPFAFTHYLSGNFAELRSNHFHAGLDFKTQGAVGKPIYAVADGYIARAKVQYGGYGRALYVMHDNGYMTVYGHLDRFPLEVDAEVRAKQYGDECYVVDVAFEPNKFRVKGGDVLAYAGNSGYSFGPHLHFEVRSADGEQLYNPMLFYKSLLADTRPPVAQAVALYPREGFGVLNGAAESRVYKVANGTVADTLNVWGKVGFGIKAVDYMDGTHNKYGVYEIQLFVDDSLRFESRMDNVSFAENRLINAWADYERLSAGKGWFLRSFLVGNNPLRALKADAARGWVNIAEERPYKVEYRLRDYHGNTSNCVFVVNGVCDTIPASVPQGCHKLFWFINNQIEYDDIALSIKRGALFENVRLQVDVDSSSLAPVYSFGGVRCPLWHNAELSLKIPAHLASYADKCYVKQLVGKEGSSAGGDVANGWVTASVSVLDRYTVAVDTLAPVLKPVNEKVWSKNAKVVFSLSDKGCGIASYKCYIDGRFVLFEYSSKNKTLLCDLKREKVSRGTHSLKIVATDKVGNETILEKTIKY